MIKPLTIFSFLVMLTSLYLSGTLIAQQISVPDWENLETTSFNTAKPHVTYIPYDTEVKVIKNKPGKSSAFLSLNGKWKFQLSAIHSLVPVNFFQPGFDASSRALIDISSIQPDDLKGSVCKPEGCLTLESEK